MSRLFIRAGRSIVPLKVTDVSWFEAVGDYIAAHAGTAQHLLHLSLSQLEGRLDPQRFARIHRTHIVNLDHVIAFRTQPDARLIADLDDGTRLPVSRAKAPRTTRWSLLRRLRLLAMTTAVAPPTAARIRTPPQRAATPHRRPDVRPTGSPAACRRHRSRTAG